MFERFTNLDVLKGIGQDFLIKFLESFTADLAAQNTFPPDRNLPAEPYFQAVAALFSAPAVLPASLLEALSAIEEMTNPACRDHIQAALADFPSITPSLQNSITPFLQNSTFSNLPSSSLASPKLGEGGILFSQRTTPSLQHSITPLPASPEHFAIQAWLALPALLASLETYTLDPIQLQGQDALDVDGFPPLRKATLRQTEAVSNNIFRVVTITKADDVFRAARADRDHCDPAPQGATLTHAILEFEFEDCPEHYIVDIRPPNLSNLRLDWHVLIIKRWLTRRGFRGFQKLSHFLLILSLALASAAAPVIDDPDTDDDDNDDDDQHRIVHHAPRLTHHAPVLRSAFDEGGSRFTFQLFNSINPVNPLANLTA